jgi:hypothetical protein
MNQSPQIRSCSYMNKYGTVQEGCGVLSRVRDTSVRCGIGVAGTRMQRNSSKVRRSTGEGAALRRISDRCDGSD